MPKYTKIPSGQDSSKSWRLIAIVSIIVICLSAFVGGTLAYFYYSDWSSSFVGMSGKVDIIAIGAGNSSIEDDNTTKLEIILDGKHTHLIPNMPIEMPANVKVSKSTTNPLIRAKIDMQLLNMITMEEDVDDLALGENLLKQFYAIIKANNWYHYTDGYFYYVGEDPSGTGGDTVLAEVDVTEDDKIVDFINTGITFPKNITSDYSGFGVKFVITFQAIQNYIPDDAGLKLPNTITNSLKIFNYFDVEE